MQITLKLYAALAPFLPAGAHNNQAEVEVAEGISVAGVLDAFGVPRRMCHLVMHNGFHIPVDKRAERIVQPGDAVAAWPPIAGG